MTTKKMTLPSEITVNLNWHIKVRLREEGFKHWKKRDDELFSKRNEFLDRDFAHHIKPLEWYKAKQDAEGYVTVQLWEFIQQFGDTIVFGHQSVFDTSIIIKMES